MMQRPRHQDLHCKLSGRKKSRSCNALICATDSLLTNLCICHPEYHDSEGLEAWMNGRDEVMEAWLDDENGDTIKIVPGGDGKS